MKKSRRTYNGVHLNKKSNTQDVVEQSLTVFIIVCISLLLLDRDVKVTLPAKGRC